MKVKSKLDVAMDGLREHETRIAGELAEIEKAVERRTGLELDLERVKGALAILDGAPPASKAVTAVLALRKMAIAKAAKQPAAKASPSPPSPPRAGPAGEITDAAFIAVWNASERAGDVAAHFGKKRQWATDRSARIRKAGGKLRQLATGRRKSKPATDDEERPAVAPPIATAPVAKVLPLRGPKCSEAHKAGMSDESFRNLWNACRSIADAANKARITVAEASARARKLRLAGLALKSLERNAGAPRTEMPETWRCQVTEQGHPCGALVFGKKRCEHLQDVHGLDGDAAELAAGFVGPVDTNANAEAAA